MNIEFVIKINPFKIVKSGLHNFVLLKGKKRGSTDLFPVSRCLFTLWKDAYAMERFYQLDIHTYIHCDIMLYYVYYLIMLCYICYICYYWIRLRQMITCVRNLKLLLQNYTWLVTINLQNVYYYIIIFIIIYNTIIIISKSLNNYWKHVPSLLVVVNGSWTDGIAISCHSRWCRRVTQYGVIWIYLTFSRKITHTTVTKSLANHYACSTEGASLQGYLHILKRTKKCSLDHEQLHEHCYHNHPFLKG